MYNITFRIYTCTKLPRHNTHVKLSNYNFVIIDCIYYFVSNSSMIYLTFRYNHCSGGIQSAICGSQFISEYLCLWIFRLSWTFLA